MELPLFPLNSVLFPGATLPLHIFEERYKKMVNLCLESNSPFGVLLIRSGSEV
ncbi:MAG: LON peptidase substrate-binding domain-containing protein, partial [Dehalococcoidia bacterium]